MEILSAIHKEYELITAAHVQLSVVETAPDSLSMCVLGEGNSWRATVAGGGGRDNTVYRERESGAIQDGRRLSVGFC